MPRNSLHIKTISNYGVNSPWPPTVTEPTEVYNFFGDLQCELCKERRTAGVSAGGNMIHTFQPFRDGDEVKPFNPENIGKQWESI
jgi:hypothetical protein